MRVFVIAASHHWSVSLHLFGAANAACWHTVGVALRLCGRKTFYSTALCLTSCAQHTVSISWGSHNMSQCGLKPMKNTWGPEAIFSRSLSVAGRMVASDADSNQLRGKYTSTAAWGPNKCFLHHPHLAGCARHMCSSQCLHFCDQTSIARIFSVYLTVSGSAARFQAR